MSRRLLVIVTALAAILISFSLLIAAHKAPHKKTFEVFVRPSIAETQQAVPMPRGVLSEKQNPISVFPERPAKGSASTASVLPGVELQAAPFQHSKDFCDLYGIPAYAITDWFYGREYYANYQNPEEFGCVDVWPFEVTEIQFNIQVDAAIDIDVQGFVYDADFTVPDCPIPSAELCATPVYTVSIPSAGHWIIGLPMSEQCCVYAPYFAGIYIYTDLMGTGADPVAESDATDVCRSYNNYQGYWEDLVVVYGWPGEMLLSSTGYTSPQNDCEVPPEECVLQYHSGVGHSYFSGWSIGDQNAVYFDPAAGCTQCSEIYPLNITAVEAAFFDDAGVGSVDVIFHFYEAGDICSGPGSEIYSFGATITDFYPQVASVSTPINVCLEGDFFLAVEYNSGNTGTIPCVLFDNQMGTVDTCYQWNEYQNYGWIEWWDFWAPPVRGWLMMSCVGTCNDPSCNPGSECSMTQGSGVAASYFASWNVDDKVAKYYDPEEYCTSPVYPYRINDVEVALYDFAGAGSLDVRVGIYLECQQPCDGPGTKVFLSDPVTVDQFYPGLTLIDLPDTVCLYEPFFVAIEYAGGIPGEIPSVLFDDNSVPIDTCHAWAWYDGYSPPWWEWSDFWSAPLPGAPMIYVNGYTGSPACDIPQCDTTLQSLWGAAFFYYFWKQPPNDEFINTRFEMPPDFGGRLEYLQMAFYEGGSSGTPDPDFYVWLSDGFYPLDSNPPYQAIADFHITYDDVVWYPGWVEIQTRQHNLIFDPGEMFHIGGSHAHEVGDTLAWLSDDGSFDSDRVSGWSGDAWESYAPYEVGINAVICPAPTESTFYMKCRPPLAYGTPGDPPANLYEIEIISAGAYDLPVTLSLLGVAPSADISANFTPNGLPPNYISTVAVAIGPDVPYGWYVLTFQAIGADGLTKTCTVTLVAQPSYGETRVYFDHGLQRTSNFGAIGNGDASQNFVWYGTNYLYDGTVISAIEGDPQEDHMALDVYDYGHFGFVPSQHLLKTYQPWCPGSAYEEWFGEIAYSHFFTEPDVIPGEYDSLFVIGLKDVDCTDFSIKIKIYYNPTDTDIPELWTGVFEDWEVDYYYMQDWGDMDTLHNLMWMYDIADPSIVLGIMSVPFYDQFCHNMTFVHNPTEVYPSGDSSFNCCQDPGAPYLFRLMTARRYRYPGYWSPDADDRSTLMVSPAFSLNPGEKHIEIWIDFGRDLNDGLTWEQWWHKILRYVGFYRGDVNASDTLELPALDVSDLLYMQNYLFKGGPAPLPFADQGNVDGKGPYAGELDFECPKNNVDVQDMVYLLNYIYKDGPPPVDHVRFIPSMWSRPSLFTNPLWN
jgi:hypothetical protein